MSTMYSRFKIASNPWGRQPFLSVPANRYSLDRRPPAQRVLNRDICFQGMATVIPGLISPDVAFLDSFCRERVVHFAKSHGHP
jgi:hypothetical protein